MRRLFKKFVVPIAALAAVPACLSEYEPFIVMMDDSYSARILASNENGFTAPDGMLIEGEFIYMADEGASALERWRRGSKVEVLCDSSGGLISPEDLVMDERGDIYFTDDSAGGLWRYDSAGRLSLIAGKSKGLISTEGIALSADGVLVGDGKRHAIFNVTAEGSVGVFLGSEYGIDKPESMAYDDRGNLYISDDGRALVYELSPAKSLRTVIDTGSGLAAPESICWANGTLYITDNENGKLYGYDTSAGKLQTIALFHGNLKDVQGIAMDNTGSIYLSVHGWNPVCSFIIKFEKLGSKNGRGGEKTRH